MVFPCLFFIGAAKKALAGKWLFFMFFCSGIIISDDILSVKEAEIKDIKALEAYVAGRRVYLAPDDDN